MRPPLPVMHRLAERTGQSCHLEWRLPTRWSSLPESRLRRDLGFFGAPSGHRRSLIESTLRTCSVRIPIRSGACRVEGPPLGDRRPT